jgi:hypothetical protein
MLLCKNKIKIFCLLTAVFLSSCTVTKGLWNRSYNETFKQFLVSNDGKLVVFLGKNYHYIFSDESGVMKELLFWGRRDLVFVDVEKTSLEVDEKNDVTGYVTIESFYTKLPRKEEIFLESIGFRAQESKPLSLRIKLVGTRYLPRDDLGYYLPQLDRTYTVSVRYPVSFFKKMAKVVLTPITVAADATILLGKIVLQPFRGN